MVVVPYEWEKMWGARHIPAVIGMQKGSIVHQLFTNRNRRGWRGNGPIRKGVVQNKIPRCFLKGKRKKRRRKCFQVRNWCLETGAPAHRGSLKVAAGEVSFSTLRFSSSWVELGGMGCGGPPTGYHAQLFGASVTITLMASLSACRITVLIGTDTKAYTPSLPHTSWSYSFWAEPGMSLAKVSGYTIRQNTVSRYPETKSAEGLYKTEEKSELKEFTTDTRPVGKIGINWHYDFF